MAAQKFGIAKLHPWQLNTVSSIMKGKDALVVQPTGSGKSLCFCIPPLQNSTTAVVLTPTISLMADQVAKLQRRDIPATFIGSAQKQDVTGEIAAGKFRVVFTTPESFFNKDSGEPKEIFLQLAVKKQLCLLAIDEAHLVDSWKVFR